jgi:hypothetical protein
MDHPEEDVGAEPQQEFVQPEETDSPSESEPEESDKERNFREIRESKRQTERENEELRRQLLQLHKENARYSSMRETETQEADLGDDEIPEGRHLKKLRQEMEAMIARHEMAAIPERLRARFSDFDRVVTAENLKKLEDSEPEIHASLLAGNDVFAKGVSAYKALKRFGIVGDSSYDSRKESVQKSASRPASSNSVKGSSPLSQANLLAQELTPELRKQLYQEMVEASRAS